MKKNYPVSGEGQLVNTSRLGKGGGFYGVHCPNRRPVPQLTMSEPQRKTVTASGRNPFDRSYNELQNNFDRAIMELLCEMGNFTIHISESPLITALDAYEVNPNVWVAEQLVNGTSDLSSTTVVLTPDSPRSAFYSLGVGHFRPQLFYKARSVREENNIYYIPFSSEVWICLFGLLLTITVALTFILARETKLPHDTPYDIIARIADEQHDDGVEWNEAVDIPPKENLLERERWEMGEILLLAIGALGQQGSSRDPSTSAARTLVLVMLLLAALAYTAYSASVISFVSLLPSTEKEQSGISMSVPLDRGISMQNTNFFKHSLQSRFEEVTFTETHKGLDEAIRGACLFIGDRDVSLTYIHRKGYRAEQKCSLARVFLGIEYDRVFAIRRNQALKELVNKNLIRMQQYGFMSRERKRTFDVRYPCDFKERSSVSGFVSFNIEDIKPALFLFGSGFLASVILLFLETFAFSGSKVVKKFFFRRWTVHDKRLNNLVSEFLRTKLVQKQSKEEFIPRPVKVSATAQLPFIN